MTGPRHATLSCHSSDALFRPSILIYSVSNLNSISIKDGKKDTSMGQGVEYYSAMPSQNAVIVYFSSKQLLPSGFAEK